MSLSAVLKRAGHECVMFDQANPETPNEVIIEEIHRQTTRARRSELPQYDQLSYAKMLAREIRAAESDGEARIRRRVRQLNADS